MSDSIVAITMPKLGLSMTEGSVAAWHVEPGAEVAAGDVIADIETSKITNELEAQVEGVFRRSVVEVGVEVPVGALIGVVAPGSASDAAIDDFVKGFAGQEPMPDDEVERSDAARQAGPEQPASESDWGAPEQLRGDYDPDAVFATHHAHKLARRLGIDLGRIPGSGRRGRISKRDVEAALGGADGKGGPPDSAAGRPAARGSGGSTAVKTTPAARRLAAEHGIDLSDVTATGSRGRVSKGDVLRHVESRATAAAKPERPAGRGEPVSEETLSPARRTIARRLAESKRNAPHYRLSVDVVIDRLLDLRRDINSGGPENNVSITDMLVRAAALALVEHPDVNIQFDGETVRKFAQADVAVAVALETGLVAPILRHADRKPLPAIAGELRELAERARAGKLLPDDLAGGTFTLSNLGMFGVKSFDAIINPPQAAIMAVGRAERRLQLGADDEARPATSMTVTLSCDHRVIDGATGARFLATFEDLLRHPGRLLL